MKSLILITGAINALKIFRLRSYRVRRLWLGLWVKEKINSADILRGRKEAHLYLTTIVFREVTRGVGYDEIIGQEVLKVGVILAPLVQAPNERKQFRIH